MSPTGELWNNIPIIPKEYTTYTKGYGRNPWTEIVPYHDIVLFVGEKQRCPDHYIAYKVIWGERMGWIVRPEEYDPMVWRMINPIRL